MATVAKVKVGYLSMQEDFKTYRFRCIRCGAPVQSTVNGRTTCGLHAPDAKPADLSSGAMLLTLWSFNRLKNTEVFVEKPCVLRERRRKFK